MLKIVLLFLISCCVNTLAASDQPTDLALNIIKQHEKVLRGRYALANPAGKNHFAPFIDFLEQLRTNWAETVSAPVSSFPEDIQTLVETTQFYFAGRTNFSQPDLHTLLTPPWPLPLEETDFSKSDWRDLQFDDIRIRVAWFKLLHQMQPKQFLERNPMSMKSVAWTLQNLNEMNVKSLNALLTPGNVKVIRTAIDAYPPFTDEFVESLAETHSKLSNGNSLFLGGDRLNVYKDLTKRFNKSVNGWYNSLWNENTAAFESEMTAQWIWINNELDYISDLLNASESLKNRNEQVIDNIQRFLGNSMRVINNANVPHEPAETISKVPEMSGNDLSLINDFCQHFHYAGQSFDVNYVSECSKVIPSLKHGNWHDAVMVVQPNDVSANLVLPLLEFSDYAKRSPDKVFRADFEQIRARMEGLQDLANNLGNLTAN